MKLSTRDSYAISAALDAGREFQTHGAMCARYTQFPESGLLPEEHRLQLRADSEGQEIYVVYSYATPIAWRTADGVVRVPDVRYSRTTGRHQSYVRGWLSRQAVSA